MQKDCEFSREVCTQIAVTAVEKGCCQDPEGHVYIDDVEAQININIPMCKYLHIKHKNKLRINLYKY